MIVRQVTVGPLEENCWIVVDDATGQGVLVDPGDEPERILEDFAYAGGRTLEAIWLTHAHFDHVGGIAGVRRAHPDVPIWLHAADQVLYERAAQSAARWGISLEAPPPTTDAYADGDTVTCGTLRFTVMHVPGHAPGHVLLHGEGIALGGDLLFAGSIGRTDLPLCDPSAMQQSLARAAQLPPDTVVLPGHGHRTTIARELATNPFLSGQARVVGA